MEEKKSFIFIQSNLSMIKIKNNAQSLNKQYSLLIDFDIRNFDPA